MCCYPTITAQAGDLRKSPADELLTDVIFPMPAEGWAVGQDETILHSVDAGQSWTQVHFVPNADQNLFSIVSIAPGHLLASGAYNLMLETEDGKTWKDEKLADLDDDYHLNCAAARGDDVLITGESGHAFLRHAGAWAKIPVPYDGVAIRLPGGCRRQPVQFWRCAAACSGRRRALRPGRASTPAGHGRFLAA